VHSTYGARCQRAERAPTPFSKQREIPYCRLPSLRGTIKCQALFPLTPDFCSTRAGRAQHVWSAVPKRGTGTDTAFEAAGDSVLQTDKSTRHNKVSGAFSFDSRFLLDADWSRTARMERGAKTWNGHRHRFRSSGRLRIAGCQVCFVVRFAHRSGSHYVPSRLGSLRYGCETVMGQSRDGRGAEVHIVHNAYNVLAVLAAQLSSEIGLIGLSLVFVLLARRLGIGL
jgi:hypothetical protein